MIVSLENDSGHKIYDVFHVRVQSVVRPKSPVRLHLGGTVDFRVQDNQAGLAIAHTWSSSNSGILSINSKSGKAKGMSVGEVNVLLSSHSDQNAASIVHIGQVQHAQVEQLVPLVLKTDPTDWQSNSAELRVRVKFYLEDN